MQQLSALAYCCHGADAPTAVLIPDSAKLFTVYQKSAPTAAAPLPGSN
jgi:hypothetical protein